MTRSSSDDARARAVEHLLRHAFSAHPASAAGERLGVEAEVIPVHADTRRVCTIESGEPRSSLAMVRAVAERYGWTERRSAKGVPSFAIPGGGVLTFEPGGQIEIASPALHSGSRVLDWLDRALGALGEEADEQGIELLTAGIDPYNGIDHVPRQLDAPRYARMEAHFARIGPAGARMMRQTAAVQVNVDAGDTVWERWHVLNAAVPYLTAIFANSPCYAGASTGHRSFRAHTWRHTDPRRTGIPFDARDAAGGYADFALGAPVISAMLPAEFASVREFPTARELAERDELPDALWVDHLSTLFPEVRPRGFLEVRSIDALPPQWYAAVVAMVGALARAPRARRAALAILPDPSLEMLCRAGRVALGDPDIASTAAALADVALAGCAELGASFLEPRHVEIAREFVARYTARRRSPADDVSAAPFVPVAASRPERRDRDAGERDPRAPVVPPS
ncbi:MAG TPA: glutamate-cysteine ligase family protein [Gemmatimonadaceae bacterium]|nr:glutamate-cysteine ligase family protein [Gemmatimonadaceae bacterium]